MIWYYIEKERESANGNNHFSSMLWFTLTAHVYAMYSSSLALKLQGNKDRWDFFPKSYFQQQLQKHVFWNSYTMFTCRENTIICLRNVSKLWVANGPWCSGGKLCFLLQSNPLWMCRLNTGHHPCTEFPKVMTLDSQWPVQDVFKMLEAVMRLDAFYKWVHAAWLAYKCVCLPL